MDYSTELILKGISDLIGQLPLSPAVQETMFSLLVSMVDTEARRPGQRQSTMASRIAGHPQKAAAKQSYRAIAASYYKACKDRDDIVGPGLIHDPVWMMLLDMFMAAEEGRVNTISSLTVASLAPNTTALRYIDLMRQRGLVTRRADPKDDRKVFIEPTQVALCAVGKTIDKIENSAGRHL